MAINDPQFNKKAAEIFRQMLKEDIKRAYPHWFKDAKNDKS